MQVIKEKNKVKQYKVLRVVIMLIFISLSYLLYYSEYNIKPEIKDIERGIEEFLEEDIEIKKWVKFKNRIVVSYTLGNNDTIGSTVLYKGINFRYQIRNAGYGSRNTVFDIENFEAYGKRYFAILGTNYDLLINKVKVEWEPSRVLNINLNDEEEVLDIFETKEEIYFREITLYDKHGEDITEKMRKYLTYESSYGCGRGKAELFLLNIFCIALLAIGYFISGIFKKSI